MRDEVEKKIDVEREVNVEQQVDDDIESEMDISEEANVFVETTDITTDNTIQSVTAVDLTSNEITLIETRSGSDSSELTTITGCESNINGSEITKSHVPASSSVSEGNESAQTESKNLVDTLIKENASLKEQLKSQTLNVHLIEGNDKATNYKKN